MSSTASVPISPRPGRIALWVLAAALLGLIAVLVWVGVRGATAYQNLSKIQQSVSKAGADSLADPAKAGALVGELSAEASSARELTSDPIWAIAEQLPWLGPQLSAFRVVSASTDELIGGAVRPLTTAMQDTSLDALKPVDGRIDPDAIAALAEPATLAADAASSAAASVAAIDQTPLVGVLNTGVGEISEIFTQTASDLDALSRATRLLPDMLGQSGPKQYLVLVQNNAEWRSLGGITGTTVLVRAEGGRVSLVDTISGTALSRRVDKPLVDLPADIQAVYGTGPSRFFQNLTQIPDFTVDGPLARQMYAEVTGTSVDGVLAVDPVVLSYLLEATGSVSLPDGSELTEQDAVPLLLNEVYKKYPDPSQQDAFFAAATGSVFQKFLQGDASTPRLVSALSRAVNESRLFVWSADEAQQSILTGSLLAGALPMQTPDSVALGVYMNESGGSKMSYYVTPDVRLTWGQCAPSDRPGLRELTLDFSFTSTAPADAAAALPTYMTGNGAFGVAPGNAAASGDVFIPSDWDVVSAETSNGLGFSRKDYGGRQVLSFSNNLAPGETSSGSVRIRSTAQVGEATVSVTPTANAAVEPVIAAACPSAGTATLR